MFEWEADVCLCVSILWLRAIQKPELQESQLSSVAKHFQH